MQSGFETRIPAWHGEDPWLHMQRHHALTMEEAHWHSHVEINFIATGSLCYLSTGQHIRVPTQHIALFWAPIPHRVVEAASSPEITCLYTSLQEFMRWTLPVRFRHEVMHGGFLLNLEPDPVDPATFDRWWADWQIGEPRLCRQVLDEVQLRLRRMALAGWRLANTEDAPVRLARERRSRGIVHVEAMASFIAEHYSERLDVQQVAVHVGLHPNYAMTLFKQNMGLPLAAYITRHRLSHAQALLADTDEKILGIAMDCGLASLSRFYEAFRNRFNKTPREYREEWRTLASGRAAQ